MVTEEWSHEHGTNRANKIVGEVHLRRYGKFIEEYTNKLREIEETLFESTGVFSGEPINLKLVRQEHTDILQLVDTDNKILNKIIIVLASLCLEVKERKDEAAQKFNALLVFGEECENDDKSLNHVAISNGLPLLQEVSCFVNRCHQIVLEIIQQLSVIYTTSTNNQLINSTNVHFEDIMTNLGDVLLICVTMDNLILGLESMHESWSLYKRLITTVQLDNVPRENIVMFESITKELEATLLSGKIFQSCIEKLSDVRQSVNSSNVSEELHLYLKNMLSSLEAKDSDSGFMVNDLNMLWVKVNCLFVLYVNLFGLHDKKVMKQMWDMAKKYPCVTLVANVIWFPDVFLSQQLSHILKPEDKKQHPVTFGNLRLDILNQKSLTIQGDVLKFTQDACNWTIQLDTALVQLTNHLTLDDLKKRCTAFLMGLKVAFEVGKCLKMVMSLHAALGKPMTKTTVLSLCKMAELLKSLELTYQRHYFLIAETVNHVLQYLVYQTLTAVTAAKNRLIGDKTYTKKHLDTLSALVLAEKVLHGAVTAERCLVARLALSVARGNTNKVLKDDEVDHIYSHLNHLNNICNLQATIRTSCDTSHLYFQRVLLPIYFQNIARAKSPCLKVSYMMSSLLDPVPTLRLGTDSKLLASFQAEILGRLRSDTIRPLCESVETNLRLQVHSHLRQDKDANNPLKAALGRDFINVMNICPMKVFDYYVDIRSYVEHYLDTTFYNLTTVALHDWKSYGEMRSLGKVKHDLCLIQNQLPYQTLEQGLDVLEIMRNIHIFVSKYLYNLNNQIFVEQSSNNKHLNTINIRHISNSIRMHGTGIMNTTVNFTYQFLRKKFYIFSQFLFDEQIKSRLTKDIVHYREHKLQTEQKYSYDRADKFNKGIRKLGLSPDGLSYLDQFRILISQIGNAMGYVRMIRSGGMHCCSNSLNFIPDLEDVVKYEDMCKEDGLSESTTEAAKRLDHVINDLTQNFAEGTQYFKLLVEVFANDFRNPKNSHLQNFYVIVPPLTINFVEYIITAKDKMNRRNKVGATFTDDGFAMGLAYVLKLLNQNKQFASLHWFQSVRDKYTKEKIPLVKSGPVEEKLKTTNMLTAKRLDTYQQEFDLLYFSMNSARIFFEKQVNE